MKNINIDGLELTQPIVDELKTWYDPKSMDSQPEHFVDYIEEAKNTLIRLMCNDESNEYLTQIKESLSELLIVQDSLKRLIPQIGGQPCAK